jgi:outer membrane protein, heavy metal efflux system
MTKFQISVVFLLTFFFTTSMNVMAEEWTLQRVKQTALQVNPQLSSLQNIVKAKEGALRQAAAIPNPEVGGITGNRSQMLALGQQLEYPGKRDVRVNQAKQELEIAGLYLKASQLQIAADAALLFTNLLWAQKNQNLLQENLHIIQKFLDAAQEKFDRGFGSKLDIIKGQVEALGAKRLLLTARKELLNDQLALKLLTRQSANDSLVLKGSLEQTIFTPAVGLDSLLVSAYRKNPTLLIQHHKLQNAQLTLQAATLAAKPDFNFDLAGGIEDNESKVELELHVPLALWDRKEGTRSEALYLKKSTENDSEDIRIQITQQVTAAYQGYKSAQQAVKLFQDSILQEARSAAQTAQQAFEMGSFRFLDLIDAQRTYLEAASEYEQSLQQLRISEIDLLRSIGMEW